MKKTVLRYLPLFLLLAFAACDSEQPTETTETPVVNEDEDTTMVAEVPAVALWQGTSVRSLPGRGEGKWLTGLVFGESIVLTGDTAWVEKEDRLYKKARLSDGTEGWVHSYLIAENASKAAATGPVVVCKRPDLSTMINDERIDRGQLIAVSNEEKEGWTSIFTKERKLQGWIKGTANLSSDDLDITVALQLDQALAEKDDDKRIELLEALVNNEALMPSLLYADVQSLLEELRATQAISNEIGTIEEHEQ